MSFKRLSSCLTLFGFLVCVIAINSPAVPLRGFGTIGGGANMSIGFLYVESCEAVSSNYIRLTISVRTESDLDCNPGNISFRLNFDDSVFTYNSAYKYAIASGNTLTITTGTGYVDYSLTGGISMSCGDKTPIIYTYFYVEPGQTIGNEFDIAFTNAICSAMDYTYGRDGKVHITDSAFSASVTSPASVINDSRVRLKITGAGFGPYTDAKLVYESGGTGAVECNTFYTTGVEAEGTDTLYAMFDLETGCYGTYSLYLGRRGGGYELVGSNYHSIDSGLDITISSSTATTIFFDVTSAAGLAGIDDSMGLAVGDCNNDGYDDIFICRSSTSYLMLNDNDGTFTDYAVSFGLNGSSTVASWADIDNDGDLDLMIDARMYRNNLIPNGSLSFTEVTSSAFSGISTTDSVFASVWADLENDGDLDVFLSRANDSDMCDNELWRNNGSGVFTEIAATAGIDLTSVQDTVGAAWGDYDNDGYMDLFICDGASNMYASEPTANALYHNNGNGTFTRITGGSLDDHHSTSGACWVDANQDGFMDIHIVNSPHIMRMDSGKDFLLINNGDGTFTDHSVKMGIFNNRASYGMSWADWDLYGAQTPLMASFGDWNQLNRQTNTPFDYTLDYGRMITGVNAPDLAHTVAWFDYDNDGDMDYIMTGGDTGVNLVLKRNNYRDSSPTKRFLEVILRGIDSNYFGVGARIEVSDGTTTRVRYITAGDGYLKMDGLRAHFGFGYIGSTTLDVTVYWPSGKISYLAGTTTDQILTVYEPINVPADYATIQGGINAAPDGGTVVVDAGTYTENIDFAGKAVHLIGDYGLCSGETIIDGSGGNAFYFHSGETSASIVEGFVITNSQHGVYASGSSNPVIKNCIFRYNDGGSAPGAGVYAVSASPTVLNNVFHNNVTTSSGSAVYMSSSSSSITNNTFWNNTSGNGYGAVRLFGCAGANFQNNIVSENIGRGITGGSSCATIDYNNVWGNTVSDYYFTDGCTTGANDISADPELEDPANGRFYLSPTSPCIGYGSDVAPGIPALDFEGDIRTYGGMTDIGADEYACQTLNVPASYSTIQEALDSAWRGDTVLVSDGTYTENIIMPCYDVTLTSVNGPDSTTIDGNALGSVITIDNGQSRYSVVEGFTLTNGQNTNGGAVNIDTASPIIRQNYITANACTTNGAGIYIKDATADPLIVNNVLYSNSAGNLGGGIYMNYSSADIINNTFDSNSGNSVAGLRLYYATNVEVHNNIFSNHTGGYDIAGASATGIIDYNDFWNSGTGTVSGLTATNSLYLDPQYVSSGSDFHLQGSSPMVDAGNNSAPGAPSVDYDDDLRPYDGNCDSVAIIDIGADEASYVSSNPGSSTLTATDNDDCADTGVSLSWSTPASWNDNGVGTRTFEIWRQSTFVTTLPEGSTTYNDTTGPNNAIYTYTVRAINGCGLSTDYTDVAGDRVSSVPDGGTTTATDGNFCTDTGVNISWTTPANWNDNGVGTRTFDIYRDTTLIATVADNLTTYIDTAGTNNTVYTYKVVAKNGCGLSTDYSSDQGVDIVSSAPDGGTTTATDDDSCDYTGVNISWTVPANWNDNGIGTRAFDIYRDSTLINSVADTVTSYQDISGADDVVYSYKVVAINGCGLTTDFLSDNAGDMNTTPAVPVISSIVDNDECTQDGVTITFTNSPVPFFDDMESGLNGWTVVAPDANNLWHQVTETTCSPSSASGSTSWYFGIDGSCSFDNGATVYGAIDSPEILNLPALCSLNFNYRKVSECGGGCCNYDKSYVQISVNGGAFSTIAEICDSTDWTSYPDINLSSYAGSDIVIRFLFDSVDSVGNSSLGLMIDDVKIYSTTSFNLVVDAVETATGITSPYIYNPGDTDSHDYTLRAVNGTCFSDSAITSISDSGSSAPDGGTTTATDDDHCGDTGVNISWAAPANWNDSGIGTRSYSIYRGATFIDSVADSETTYNDNLGTNNQSYNYTVVAVNGCGLTTSYASQLANDFVPSIPDFGTTTAADDNSCTDTGVNISWNIPDNWNDNGFGTRSFTIYRGTTAIATSLSETTVTYNDDTGVNNQNYTYKVIAVNGCGYSSTYSESQLVADFVTSAPGSGTTTATDLSTVLYSGNYLSWGTPDGGWNDNGTGSRSFQIYRDGALISTVDENTFDYTDTGASPDIAHNYLVYAVNGCSITTAYTGSQATDSVILPDNMTMGKSGTDITVQWDSVVGADAYNLYMGNIGTWYNHDGFNATGLDNDGIDGSCNEPLNNATFEMPAGNVYFLVSAGETAGEGSLGQDSLASARPPAVSPCQP